MTHQVLGAEAPDLGINVGSDPDKMNIPGTNGPDRLQGACRASRSPTGRTSATTVGNSFNFRDNRPASAARFKADEQSSTPRRDGVARSADQSLPAAGGTFQTVRGTFNFTGQSTMLPNAPTPADARFNSWAAFLLGLPFQAGKVDQLLNPNSIYMKTWAAYVQDTCRRLRT